MGQSTLAENDPHNHMLLDWISKALQEVPTMTEEMSTMTEYILALLTTDAAELDPIESCKEKLTDFLGDESSQFVDSLFGVIRSGSYKVVPRAHVAPLATKQSESDHDEENESRRRRRGSFSDDEDRGDHKLRRKEPNSAPIRVLPQQPRNDTGRALDRPMPSRDEQEFKQRNNAPFPRGGGRQQGGGNQFESWGGRGSGGRGGQGFGYGVPPPRFAPGMMGSMGFGQMGFGGMSPMMMPPYMMDGMFDPHMMSFGGMGPPQGHHGPPQGHHGPPPGHHGPPQGHHGPPHQGLHGALQGQGHFSQQHMSPRDRPAPPQGPQQPQQSESTPVGFNPDMLRNEYINPFEQQQQQQLAHIGDNLPVVPEALRCTVRCSGVPIKIEEKEVLGHFQTFGKVIYIRKIAAPPSADDKKTYNEFLVQFELHDDANKCVNSPKPVLDNRFIRLHTAQFNLIQLEDVPSYLAEGRDADINPRKVGASGEEGSEENRPKRVNPLKEKAAAALKQKYDDLVLLRQNQEEIFKKKQLLMQRQVEEYRNLIAKVSSYESTEANRTMIENIEGKLLDVQSKLRSLEDEKARLAAPAGAPGGAGASKPMGSVFGGSPSTFVRGGGRGGRFDGGGRFDAARGRGRGRFGGRVGNLSFDNRPKTLVITSAPAEFENSAANHFARFGQVVAVSGSIGSGAVYVEFSKRAEAELAKARGSYFQNEVLSIGWKESAAVTEESGADFSEAAGEDTIA